MKVTYRIPAKEQYGYIEIEAELDPEKISIENTLDRYDQLVENYKAKAGPGLSDKDFNAFVDKYLESGTGSADVYAQMNVDQQKQVQCIKRAFARIKSKENKHESQRGN